MSTKDSSDTIGNRTRDILTVYKIINKRDLSFCNCLWKWRIAPESQFVSFAYFRWPELWQGGFISWNGTNLDRRLEMNKPAQMKWEIKAYLTATVQTLCAETAITGRTLMRDADQLGAVFQVYWTLISINSIKVHSYFCLTELNARPKV
jgi:hypothetical protein